MICVSLCLWLYAHDIFLKCSFVEEHSLVNPVKLQLSELCFLFLFCFCLFVFFFLLNSFISGIIVAGLTVTALSSFKAGHWLKTV